MNTKGTCNSPGGPELRLDKERRCEVDLHCVGRSLFESCSRRVTPQLPKIVTCLGSASVHYPRLVLVWVDACIRDSSALR